MLTLIKEMMTAAVNRVAVILVSAAANKIEAAAFLSKAGTDAEVEGEARTLEALGHAGPAQTLRLRAAGIASDAPAATALPALAHLTGEAQATTPSVSCQPQLLAAGPAVALPKRGPGRPKSTDTAGV